MAGVNTVSFEGGPCNGLHGSYSNADLADGAVTCRGTVYLVQGIAPNLYVAKPEAATTPTTAPGSTYAPDLFRAYHDLKRSLVYRLRPAVTRAQRYDRIALLTLARKSKVRKH